MVVHPAEFAAELKVLRKGRGIYVPQIGERVGSALREVCGVAAGDSAGEIRRKVSSRLEEMAARLPDDLQVAVLAALAIHAGARLPFYQDRIRWVARYLDRDERTARRRVDDGISQLAEMAASASAAPDAAVNGVRIEDEPVPATWRVAELRSILLLDQADREVIELRRIVAERDDLEELDLAFTLPRHPAYPRPQDLHIEVLYGGILVPRPAESSERRSFELRLSHSLAKGEQYEYGLRFRVPEGQPVRPHYTCISKLVHDQFDLRVRFAADRPPEQVWKLSGAFQRDVDDPVPSGEPVSPDPSGELHLTFRYLTPGLAYGVRWQDG